MTSSHQAVAACRRRQGFGRPGIRWFVKALQRTEACYEACASALLWQAYGGASRRRGVDPLFGCDLERAFECELNLAGSFLARVAVRHDPGPFDDLGDKAFVGFLRRIPDANFVLAEFALHGDSSR